MRILKRQSGFSLAEVLIAVGILAVGMMLVATMFPVGIYLTSVSAERTMAAIVADEAFAKIQFYGLSKGDSDGDITCYGKDTDIDPNEFIYPSSDEQTPAQYCWYALMHTPDANATEGSSCTVTVFVCRKTSPADAFSNNNFDAALSDNWPNISKISGASISIGDVDKLKRRGITFSNTVNLPVGIVLFDNKSGRLFKIVDRKKDSNGDVYYVLDHKWGEDLEEPDIIWHTALPDGGGKSPEIGVYQRVINF